MKVLITSAVALSLLPSFVNGELRRHRHAIHGDSHDLQKRSKQCQFPTDAGLVSVTPNEENAGWAMSPDQPCKPGMYCPYACPAGQVGLQWDPKATSYTYPISQNGGLYCNEDGEIEKPFPKKDYCADGTGYARVNNTCGGVISFCQTVLPGNEAMLIPTEVHAGMSEVIAVPDPSYWVSTAAHYYINAPGVGIEEGCVWGTKANPIGNWSPYVAGANTDASGNTFVKIGWNPVYLEPDCPFKTTLPDFGMRLVCDGSCVGLPCEINPKVNGVNEVTSLLQADGAGGGAFCVGTAQPGSHMYIEVFEVGEGSGTGSSDSESSDEIASFDEEEPVQESSSLSVISTPESTTSSEASTDSTSSGLTTSSEAPTSSSESTSSSADSETTSSSIISTSSLAPSTTSSAEPSTSSIESSTSSAAPTTSSIESTSSSIESTTSSIESTSSSIETTSSSIGTTSSSIGTTSSSIESTSSYMESSTSSMESSTSSIESSTSSIEFSTSSTESSTSSIESSTSSSAQPSTSSSELTTSSASSKVSEITTSSKPTTSSATPTTSSAKTFSLSLTNTTSSIIVSNAGSSTKSKIVHSTSKKSTVSQTHHSTSSKIVISRSVQNFKALNATVTSQELKSYDVKSVSSLLSESRSVLYNLGESQYNSNGINQPTAAAASVSAGTETSSTLTSGSSTTIAPLTYLFGLVSAIILALMS